MRARAAWFLLACACGCGGGDKTEQTASAASSPQRVSSAAAAILNTPQQTDVLTAAKQAMASAAEQDWSDEVPAVPALTSSAASAVQAASDVVLHESCERYFRRVDACFATQGEDAALLQALNQDARSELAAAASAPGAAECEALNLSFHAVAANLGCR